MKLQKLLHEPPIRFFVRAACRTASRLGLLPTVLTFASRFDGVAYASYATALLAAIRYAKHFGIPAFSALEFGVAGGNGLIALDRYAAVLSKKSGIEIRVTGFDSKGLPASAGFRDAPWIWNPGDFPGDYEQTRKRIRPQSELVIGLIRETFPMWLNATSLPVGFISVDVDYYSSTLDVLHNLQLCDHSKLLPIVSMYFDDIHMLMVPDCVGEMEAIREFNSEASFRKIQRETWIRYHMAFPELHWVNKLYALYSFDHPLMNFHQDRQKLVLR